MKRSKAYRQAAEKIDPERLYSPAEAVGLAKDTATTKFDPTVEVALRLGVDPRKADQMVRGTVNLPNGTGKTARVLVFATGDRAAAAEAAGADYVGSDDLLERIQGGFLDFDAVVATPDLMGKVGRLGRVLGPRGLMPNPKTGTVTADVAKAVTEIKGGKIEFRVDRHGNLHFVIGKASFPATALVENYAAALDEVHAAQAVRGQGQVPEEGGHGHQHGAGHPGRPGQDPRAHGRAGARDRQLDRLTVGARSGFFSATKTGRALLIPARTAGSGAAASRPGLRPVDRLLPYSWARSQRPSVAVACPLPCFPLQRDQGTAEGPASAGGPRRRPS